MRWMVNPHVAWADDNDAVAVATVPDTQVYRLESSGVLIWDALAQHPNATTREVIRSVASAAEVPADRIRDDVSDYLQHLRTLGIVIARE
ncbi:PqqD family protein [Cutibacterium sp. WCA-380-WT-3A]|uniref:PqqD family protein n=1 Tax=Cutibacterium porci TaxID=2605781 RepID=A0A7K0J4H5_9ACTN|nr:PqqD family protein [Cutibacterium porci]MSS44840.1 PqqD family protein [Cutibacterium porci]